MPSISTDEEISKRFDELLNVTKEVGTKQYEQYVGSIFEGLVEEEDSVPGFLTSRLSNNALVHFKGDKSLIGSVMNFKLDECKGFYYNGSIAN